MVTACGIKIRLKETQEKVIIHCHRHHYGYYTLKMLGLKPDQYERVSEGFIDHKGTYMTREQAYEHALECGQISATMREQKQNSKCKELFSEDLW